MPGGRLSPNRLAGTDSSSHPVTVRSVFNYYISIGLGFGFTPHPVFFMGPDDLILILAPNEDDARRQIMDSGAGGQWSSIYCEVNAARGFGAIVDPTVTERFTGDIIPLRAASIHPSRR